MTIAVRNESPSLPYGDNRLQKFGSLFEHPRAGSVLLMAASIPLVALMVSISIKEARRNGPVG